LSSVRETRLSIAVYVPHALRTRFETFIAPRHTVIRAASWTDLTVIIRQQHIDLVLVDPAVEGGLEIERIAWLLAEFPSTATVVYTTMTPATVGAVYELSKRGLYRVMLYSFDDTPERLALLFDGLPLRRLLPAVLAALHIDAAPLPTLIQERVRAIFESPTSVHSVAEFARSVGVSRQHLYSLFREAGLGPPGRLLLGAQLAQACAYLRDPGFSVAAVATKIGWTDLTALKRALERAFGMPMTHLRRYQPAEHLIERLVGWMQAGWK
jgi:AraC-like DNA-binding protein